MQEAQIADLWKVTSGMRADLQEILVAVARLEEREVLRSTIVEAQVQGQAERLSGMEHQLRLLDRKIAAAMGGVLLIAWGLQLLVPTL